MTTDLLLGATALTTGLVAGLFAAFAYAVMPGLRRVDDVAFVQTMRGVNVAIINPVFGLLFGGSLVLGIASTVVVRGEDAFAWAVAGLVGYVLTLVVTIARNVPLNEALENGTDASPRLREAFERPWTRWNLVRTATNVASTACWLVALALA
ncbi:DUF1772 domain-containing protein [Aeromicrobium sp. Leaf350]|uniref:anthrone oxygenase family protein n=1 Tax=Aeromicrobium sp. Leaf350 TaxID=2876565 RepID=UPI001E5C4D62|nr:anthrone oxygenase family protein [Aeromicrobium sp. Leaf350]